MPLALTTTETSAADAWLGTHYPYQLRWALEPARFAACNKGRQLGLSHANATGCVVGGLLEQRPQIILSASQDLSDEVMTKVRTHCRVLADLGFHRAAELTVDSASEVAWKSGGRVIALPANPRTARGWSGDLWLDEAAYHLDPQGIRDATFPIAIRGNWRIRVVSTPNGAQGLFYDLMTSPPKGWSLHEVPLELAIDEGLEIDQQALWSLCGGDERLFAQWFRCAFLDADLQYVPTALADRALRWTGALPSLEGATLYAGLDVGRTHDLTVLTILAVVGRVAWVVAILTCKRTAFRAQRAMVRQAREAFGWATLHVDKSGLGSDMAEELVEWWGDDEVRLVDFTNPAKGDLATRALRWLRDGRVRYPQNDDGRALHAETIAVRRKVTAAGQISFEVPRSAKGHGDRFWSLALALRGCGEPVSPSGMGFEPLLHVA